MLFTVKYRNHGKPERTPLFATREKAEESAAFLRFQGAACVRIHQIPSATTRQPKMKWEV